MGLLIILAQSFIQAIFPEYSHFFLYHILCLVTLMYSFLSKIPTSLFILLLSPGMPFFYLTKSFVSSETQLVSHFFQDGFVTFSLLSGRTNGYGPSYLSITLYACSQCSKCHLIIVVNHTFTSHNRL